MTSATRTVAHETIGDELIREWVPESQPKAHIVLVHGIAEHSGRYERTGRLLAEAGFFVRSFDLIGAGGTEGDRWDIDDWTRYHDQIEHHMEWARSQGGPVVLLGHSMGGNLVLGYAIDADVQPDLIVVSAPALEGGAAWQKALAPIAARFAPTFVMPNGVKGEDLSRDPEVGETYFDDPLVVTKSTMRLGAALFAAMDHVCDNAHSIGVPMLVLHGGQDPAVPPQSTAFLGDLDGCERKLYPELRHEILNEPEGPEVVADIVAWINEQLAD